MKNKIRNKIEMYDLYERGDFGNRFECWPSLDALIQSDHPGPFNIRHKTLGLSGWIYMNLSRSQLIQTVRDKNLRPYECHFTAGDQADARYRTFQGEVQEDEHGWSLHYSFARLPMRPALAEHGAFAQGLAARWLIRRFMDAPSYENLLDLFDRYPGHVVEFTCFSRKVGVLGWNTVYWEVRSY